MNVEFTLESIKKYILDQLKNNESFFFNELEVQMFVARKLEQVFKDGYKIHVEYQLPRGWNKVFDDKYQRWGTEKPYFDIVVENENNNKFIAIELKYKLKEIKLKGNKQFLRFGEKSYTENLVLVTNQSAENEGRYDFWKDVKRIEILTKSFSRNVVGGIAIFVTNQKKYQNNKSEFKYSNFNLSNSKGGFLYWGNNNYEVKEDIPKGEKLKKNKEHKENWGENWEHWERPNFTLEYKYSNLEWISLNNDFHCYSVIIPPFSVE